jgi:hypothetical protein
MKITKEDLLKIEARKRRLFLASEGLLHRFKNKTIKSGREYSRKSKTWKNEI